MAIVPQLFTSTDPYHAQLAVRGGSRSLGHVFGTINQGYDIYARTIYGARASSSSA